MAIKVSTGARNKLLDTGSFKSIFDGGKILIYAGAVPADADAAVTGSLLATITNNGTATGITFAAAASAGAISKNTGEVWSNTGAGNSGTGTATHYRLVAAADDGTLSITQARLQGTVGVAAADLNLSSINLTTSAIQTIDFYSVALPTA